jgi:molybdopterin-synthase adenylyltransferase
MRLSDTRYSRNEALFGAEGQAKIAATKVMIVGLGGLGSHVAQQLAYLGVADFTLVDKGNVKISSLNRMIGAVEDDAAKKRPKVEVCARLVGQIQPEATITPFCGDVDDDQMSGLVAEADVVFGCLDRDLPRLKLTDLCAQFAHPLFDLATDTGEDEVSSWYGGRIILCDGSRCLSCLDLLDQKEMARDSMGPGQRDADDAIYGIDVSALDATGPSVVSLNGVVASLAVTEFMVMVTGMRKPFPYLTYRGDLRPMLRENLDEPRENCPYCATYNRPTQSV